MAMPVKTSPQKRKHTEEYHDPDYPKQISSPNKEEANLKEEAACKRRREESSINEVNASGTSTPESLRLNKVCATLEREFKKEINSKRQQLQEIEGRLDNAKKLLDRLRFSIVTAYYSQQDIPLEPKDAAAIRGPHTLFDREDKGPQLQLHPSIKRLIHKRPRSCPQRSAAQQAKETIRAKTEIHKKVERRLQKLIRHQGIIIDHTDPENSTIIPSAANISTTSQRRLATAGTNTPNTPYMTENKIQKSESCSKGKALNTTRLNNKIKHLIVVGNTSKYIGPEQEPGRISQSHPCTHKWLVYVQAKESHKPLELYIKKVRFFLHQSYRPNDVIDVHSPPYQLARRGWGEFPVRVQLFFHPEYHQKPIQLIHNIVLDKTLTGLQTLGAETLLEIYLRDAANNSCTNVSSDVSTIEQENVDVAAKCPSPKTDELVDDNLLEFLNKIEATPVSADLEKIHPTIGVIEPLTCKLKNPSTIKSDLEVNRKQLSSPEKSPTCSAHFNKNVPNYSNESSTSTQTIPSETSNTKAPIITEHVEGITTTASHTTSVTLSSIPQEKSCPTVSGTSAMTARTSSIILKKDGRILMPAATSVSAVKKAILPITKSTALTETSSPKTNVTSTSSVNALPLIRTASMLKPVLTLNGAPQTQILQKKMVQMVDAKGQVKYIQMLINNSNININNSTPTTSISPTIPRIFNVTPFSVKKVGLVNNTNQAFSGTGTQLTNGVGPITLTMKPTIVRLKPVVRMTADTTTATTTTTTTATTLSFPKPVAMPIVLNSNFNQQQLRSPQVANKIGPVATATATTTATPTKNSPTCARSILYKEGKLCIFDPLQMKLKQQQRKQISLLKPQISLLKQKQMQQQKQAQGTVADDHNYIPKPRVVTATVPPPPISSPKELDMTEVQQLKRLQLEKSFPKQNITSVRSAVEYLLHHLPLAPSEAEFQTLPPLKQRVCEWMRAKNVSTLLHSHKGLQELHKKNGDVLWSTREIVLFARQHVYTPAMKIKPKLEHASHCSTLVKHKLNEDTPNAKCCTLAEPIKLKKWLNKTWQIVMDCEPHNIVEEVVDVIGVVANNSIETSVIPYKEPLLGNKRVLNKCLTYMTPPSRLKNECQLVLDICKDLRLNLQPEELESDIWYPAALTVLAKCLQRFMEKLLRESIAFKLQKDPTSTVQLFNQDIIQMLNCTCEEEFDFLTNKNFGSSSRTNSSITTQTMTKD